MSSHNPKNYGLVVAAGRGLRFKGLKQFALVRRKPLLLYSLQAFEQCPAITGIIVVTNRTKVSYVKKLVIRFSKVLAVVAGGRTRTDSVRHGLGLLPEEGFVAVHDAVRPLVTPEMLSAGFRVCRGSGPATYGYQLDDTIKKVTKARIIETIDRKRLFAVQTPQFFPLHLLGRAHMAAEKKGIQAGDDCALVEYLGIKPRVITGPRYNIKVTTQEDLEIVKRLL